MPMMRVNILSKTRPSEPNNLNYEEAQLYSVMRANGIDPTESRSSVIHQGNYRHLAGINNNLRIDLQSN